MPTPAQYADPDYMDHYTEHASHVYQDGLDARVENGSLQVLGQTECPMPGCEDSLIRYDTEDGRSAIWYEGVAYVKP